MQRRERLLIVPRRNWNPTAAASLPPACWCLLIVPRRNWNKVIPGRADDDIPPFNCTKEELKLGRAWINRRQAGNLLIVPRRNWNSLECGCAPAAFARPLLIVPRRNWNMLQRYTALADSSPFNCTKEELKSDWDTCRLAGKAKLLIVPRRNWNWTSSAGQSRRWYPF